MCVYLFNLLSFTTSTACVGIVSHYWNDITEDIAPSAPLPTTTAVVGVVVGVSVAALLVMAIIATRCPVLDNTNKCVSIPGTVQISFAWMALNCALLFWCAAWKLKQPFESARAKGKWSSESLPLSCHCPLWRCIQLKYFNFLNYDASKPSSLVSTDWAWTGVPFTSVSLIFRHWNHHSSLSCLHSIIASSVYWNAAWPRCYTPKWYRQEFVLQTGHY